jgi:hypothetical protein
MLKIIFLKKLTYIILIYLKTKKFLKKTDNKNLILP